jgi:hypothetical protein
MCPAQPRGPCGGVAQKRRDVVGQPVETHVLAAQSRVELSCLRDGVGQVGGAVDDDPGLGTAYPGERGVPRPLPPRHREDSELRRSRSLQPRRNSAMLMATSLQGAAP